MADTRIKYVGPPTATKRTQVDEIDKINGIIDKLKSDIPRRAGRTDRFAGTKAEKEAAKFTADYLKSLGVETKIDEYQFMGWECLAPSKLAVSRPETKKMDAAALIYCASTPAKGVEGTLKYMGKYRLVLFEWDRYAIVDSTGKVRAYVVGINDDDGFGGYYTPLPRPEPWEYPEANPVIVTVGNRDNELLKKWWDAKKPIKVNLKTRTKYKPQSTTYNVVGTLDGSKKPDEKIVIGCHIDSEYNVPGASDNASGVATVLTLAGRIKNQSRTLEFIGFGAEEYGYIGSRARVRDLRDSGMISNITAMINIDTIAHPEATYIWLIAPENDRIGIRAITKRAIEAIGLDKTHEIRWAEPVAPGGVDSYPYHVEGVPTLCIVWWPFPTMHTIEENKIKPEQIKVTADLVEAIVHQIEKI